MAKFKSEKDLSFLEMTSVRKKVTALSAFKTLSEAVMKPRLAKAPLHAGRRNCSWFFFIIFISHFISFSSEKILTVKLCSSRVPVMINILINAVFQSLIKCCWLKQCFFLLKVHRSSVSIYYSSWISVTQSKKVPSTAWFGTAAQYHTIRRWFIKLLDYPRGEILQALSDWEGQSLQLDWRDSK